MSAKSIFTLSFWIFIQSFVPSPAQTYGEPDRDQPGDALIQAYLRSKAEKIHDRFLSEVDTQEQWEQHLPEYRKQYFEMLGLWPLPKKTPLRATSTGHLERKGFIVEMIHYQSRPGLYVTGNLYRPAKAKPGQRFPAVFYVCGHRSQGRNGNKTSYQSHGAWFARHGYVCLVVDTLQMGEIEAIHHGTYREQRWWWLSRGYTPAGVECWNGVRGIDYLLSRDDVDPARIAVTGISGGGASTFWIAAADPRVAVAVPVSGMADLPSYVSNHVINGHCDCMFLHNTYQWPWTRIAALLAPRPLLFVNSDHDRIFPMDANDRVINRLARVYNLFGAGDRVDSLVSMGGHSYREDIRRAAYRFINTYLKDDPRSITDSEVDLVTGTRENPIHPIDPAALRVFPADSDIPGDELNTKIDELFVPMVTLDAPTRGGFGTWKQKLKHKLRQIVFRDLPQRVPTARLLQDGTPEGLYLETEPGIRIQLRGEPPLNPAAGRILLVVTHPDPDRGEPVWLQDLESRFERVYHCDVRGVGMTRWSRKNPPNYVERSHVLLGSTVDAGRVWDVAATSRYLASQHPNLEVHVAGAGSAGILGAYAALWEPEIATVYLFDPNLSHMDSAAPQFLNVLRVCDIPEVLGMLAPRPLNIGGAAGPALDRVRAIYQAAASADALEIH